jgi:hypothetical protein
VEDVGVEPGGHYSRRVRIAGTARGGKPNLTSTTVIIGGVSIRLSCRDHSFSHLLRKRYANFLGSCDGVAAELTVNLLPGVEPQTEADLQVRYRDGAWQIQRGDFRAEWDRQTCRGMVWQQRSPYALDSVLRILHTLILAERGGFLLHAASMIRNGRAFLFAGQSGAGKTTMCRLAPPDTVLLTDEISFVRPVDDTYCAFGTPFYGELAVPGTNTFAPVDSLYLLEHSDEDRVESVPPRQALAQLLRNVLLFAHESESVGRVFATAFDLISRVPVRRLRFAPTPRVWSALEQLACS